MTIENIDDCLTLLRRGNYVGHRSLATTLFLALRMERPLFLEGEAGVGKTEVAKVLSQVLGRPLFRLQCYDGLDQASALYDWNYQGQMVEIRLAEARREIQSEDLSQAVFSERFLIKRPLLQALESDGKGPAISWLGWRSYYHESPYGNLIGGPYSCAHYRAPCTTQVVVATAGAYEVINT